MVAPWYHRFMASTRGRLITLLRRDSRTVDELAEQLELTDNAVRAHLATLERDGIVEQRGVRRSGSSGKPAFTYDLTPAAEQLFLKPYAAVLDETLSALNRRMPEGEVESLLRESGYRLAQRFPPASGDLHARLEAAVTALNQLGGLAELEVDAGEPGIRGYSCVLASLAPTHPEVCRLAESFVSEVAGTPMRECCDRSSTPQCRFVPASPG